MLHKVTTIKIAKNGFDDATFEHTTIITNPIFVRSDHENQYREVLRNPHGYRMRFDITLTDIMQPNFNINLQRMASIFADTAYKTNEVILLYPDYTNEPTIYFECYIDSNIEPHGESQINTGHGSEFSLITAQMQDVSFSELVGMLIYSQEEEPE